MSRAVLDDHLIRDLLANDTSSGLEDILRNHQPATTNMYLLRLCRSVTTAAGGSLTGSWPLDAKRRLARELVSLPAHIEIVPMRTLALRIAELADDHKLSTLGAEAVAAAEHLNAPLCVWTGDDGPHIRAAMISLNSDYLTVSQ